MKLHHLIIGCALLLAESTFGQRAALFYSSADIEITQSDTNIRNVWPQKFGKNMRIKYKNGVKLKVAKDSVWGYRDRKGHLFRMYKGTPYQVMENKEIVKYSYETLDYFEPYWLPSYEVRYSKTLDSPIVFSKKKARRGARRQ